MERFHEIVWKLLLYKTKKSGKKKLPDSREIKRIARGIQVKPEQVKKAAHALINDQSLAEMTRVNRRSNVQVAMGCILYSMRNSQSGWNLETLRRNVSSIAQAIDEPVEDCQMCANFLITHLVNEQLGQRR